MTTRARAMTLILGLGFVAFLLWSTLASQRVECAVSVDFRGRAGERHGIGFYRGQRGARGPDGGMRPDHRVDGRTDGLRQQFRRLTRHCRTL